MRRYALRAENVYTCVREKLYPFLMDVMQLLIWSDALDAGFVKKAVQQDV